MPQYWLRFTPDNYTAHKGEVINCALNLSSPV